MKKISFLLLSALLSVSGLSAKKNTVPYCYQGHYTDTSSYIWCMIDEEDSSNPVFTYIGTEAEEKEIKGTWNAYGKYTYGHLRIDGLQSNTSYTLQLNRKKILDFKTRNPQQDTVQLLIGSCAMKAFGPHWIFRPKVRYPIYDAMSAESNDAMLWMGDNIYLLGKEPYSDKKQIKKYLRTRRVPQLANFMQSTPQYSMWDDHDFGPNNSDGSFKLKDTSLKNFQHFWANPAPVDSAQGIYYSIQFPQTEIFMTDNRYHAVNGERYFSDEQMQWLLNSLKQSDATFKIIISGNQANNTLTRHETLYSTGEFKKISDFISKEKVTGVIFVNGDRHHSEMLKHQIDGLYPIYEFTNSSMTSIPSGIGKRNREFNNPARIHGVSSGHVYGKISIYPSDKNTGAWLIRLSTISKKGKLRWEQIISSDELKW